METFYLIDFENVHNEGLENIDALTQSEHVHIFSTENAPNIRMDIVFSKGIDIEGHIVPVRKQSLDMHLVSYLGHLLGIHGKKCTYVIISRDTDYDNIIQFWKDEGYPNISRKQKIPGTTTNKKKNVSSALASQSTNSRNSAEHICRFSGKDRCALNTFMQHGLLDLGYVTDDVNEICKYVIAHCNDESMLSGIHNALRNEYEDYLEVYEDVKMILGKFKPSKNKNARRESQVRSFFAQHSRQNICIPHQEEIIRIIINAKTKQQINNGLMKLYADGRAVKRIYQTIQPLIKDLPGR